MSEQLVKELHRLAIAHRDLMRFVLVGGIGFCVDGGLLILLIRVYGWSPLAARIVGFPVAVTITWLLNRIWTFQTGRSQPKRRQYVVYLLIQLAGLGINFTVFALLVRNIAWFAAWPVAALAIGAALAMCATYIMSRRIAFAAT